MIDHYQELINRAIELDPEVATNLKWGMENLEKGQVQIDSKGRYSMTAFDPLLCDENPVPECQRTDVTRVRKVPSLKLSTMTPLLKAPKRGIRAKDSPRRDGIH